MMFFNPRYRPIDNPNAPAKISFKEEKEKAEKKRLEKERPDSDEVYCIFKKKFFEKTDETPQALPMDEFRQELAEEERKGLRSVFDTDYDKMQRQFKIGIKHLKNDPWGSKLYKSIKKLWDTYEEIYDLVNAEKSDHKTMRLIHKKLTFALDEFKKLKESNPLLPGTNLPIEMLHQSFQDLAYQVTKQAKGMQVHQKIGKHAVTHWIKNEKNKPTLLENDPTRYSASYLANHVEEAFFHMPAHHWDTPLDYLAWVVKHFKEFLFALLDKKVPGCDRFYNSSHYNNVTTCAGFFGINGKDENIIQQNMGPGSMNNPVLAEASLASAKRKRVPVVSVNLQFRGHKGEEARLGKDRDLAEKSLASQKTGDEMLAYTVVGMTLDGLAKGKDGFGEITTVKDFHDKLRDKLIDKNGQNNCLKIPEDIRKYIGFALPATLYTDSGEAIERAITTSQHIFEEALGTGPLNPYKDKKQNARLCGTMAACFSALLSIQMLVKLGITLDDLPKKEEQPIHAIIERNCKQCADRGPVANAALIAFVQMIANENEAGAFTAEDIVLFDGILLGRAEIASDRKMVENRRETFIDLLKIIGEKNKVTGEENDKAVAMLLKQFAVTELLKNSVDHEKFLVKGPPIQFFTGLEPTASTDDESLFTDNTSRSQTPQRRRRKNLSESYSYNSSEQISLLTDVE
jgi:hypothetical protein